MRKTLLLLAIGCTGTAYSQLKIDNATFFIGAGATVTVQGDVTSNVDIQGTGTLLLKGSALQNVDMGGFTIPNLQMDNTANATLINSNARIGSSLVFTNGKIQTGNFNLILSPTSSVTGAATNRFVWTNGTGQLIKQLTSDVAAFELPVGENANYRPAYLTTAGSAYASGQFGVRVLGAADPNKPPSTAAYLNTAWPVTKSGITGGTVTIAGQYIDPTDVNGTEANIFGYYYDNATTDWSSAGETHNAATNRVSAPVAGASTAGVLSGINKFVLVGARAFLQGAYDAPSGLMTDNLRTLPGFGTPAVSTNFPSTDPYRVAPYNTAFTHVSNNILETIPNSGIIGSQAIAANNIVDWVFLELRNLASPGNAVVQTRSALIQRDGDIVDVDGVSPVTFNDIADGNYIVTVRHRNHLGLSMDPSNVASQRLQNEARSTAFAARVADLRLAPDAQLSGTVAAYTTATHPSLTTINMLWGGNANFNTATRFTGLNNDRDYILINTLGNNPSAFLNNVYHAADINLNKVVRFTGLNNDRDFLLINVLGNVPSTFRTQVLPN